jgi:hypothetical protein
MQRSDEGLRGYVQHAVNMIAMAVPRYSYDTARLRLNIARSATLAEGGSRGHRSTDAHLLNYLALSVMPAPYVSFSPVAERLRAAATIFPAMSASRSLSITARCWQAGMRLIRQTFFDAVTDGGLASNLLANKFLD